jgi:leucyl aminopeptidase
MLPFFAIQGGGAVPIWFLDQTSWPQVRGELDPAARAFADAAGFEPKEGRSLLLPGAHGLSGVLFGIPSPETDPFAAGRLPGVLPAGTYRFGNSPPNSRLAVLGLALGLYRFQRYRDSDAKHIRLEPPAGIDTTDLTRIIEGVTLARDLINTPANDMGPDDLDQAARTLAARHGADVRTLVGDQLAAPFPLIHAVGRAASRPPRLIDLNWGEAAAPKVALLGKGVTFDTGGLDIKPESAMLIMKKDMGGAACVLGLAHMVMDRRLPVRLRVVIPAVENAISGSAFRPLDIYRSRKGLTVEIGNTDAEGRLILADCLALADEEKPDLIFDLATLTGAARVALGPDLPPFYTEDDALAAELAACGLAENDPLWRMPLWRGYENMLDSKVADVRNAGSGNFAGSITAALFLEKFVAAKSWTHIDLYAWTPAAKPGRPEGGECQAARAIYALLQARYGR